MNIKIRRAKKSDIDRILKLLNEVLELHAQIRPDIFISGKTKYTKEELEKMLSNDDKPIFVAVNDDDVVMGYTFCQLKRQPFSTNMRDFTSLFIDDLCVDAEYRNLHIATKLFDFVYQYAKDKKCYDITLNVWEGNDGARAFYEKKGMFVKETQMELIIQ